MTVTKVVLKTTGNTSDVSPNVRGMVEAVSIKYNGADSLTVSLRRTEDAATLDDIILLTGNTDIVVYPRASTHDNIAVASLYAATGEPVEDKMPVYGTLTLTVTSAGGAEVVDVEVYLSN